MRISHFFEWESSITGGQAQSVKNQRKILDRKGIEYTTKPDLDADILHLNNMGPKSIYYARKARKEGVAVVIHGHQTSEDFRNSFAFSNVVARPLRPYLKYAYSLADALVCPTEHNRRVLEDYTDARKEVISNGFDAEKLEGFGDLREEYLDRYDLEPPVVFMVGHVLERKGVDTFVETARKNPEIDFAWFGYINPTQDLAGKLLQKRSVKRTIESSPDNCTFTGYIEDVRGAFAAGDIFFFPTHNENEGISLLEAMYCGKPPVVRDIDAFSWLDDGKSCLKSDGSDFSDVIERMTEDSSLRDEIGAEASRKAESRRLESVGDQMIELYEDLI